MPRYRITIKSKERKAMLDLVRKHKIQILDHGSGSTADGSFQAHALAEPSDIDRLEEAGYEVHRHEDVDEVGKQRQQEVARGDRYKSPGRR